MNRLFLLLALLLLPVACGCRNADAQRLVGEWRLDSVRTLHDRMRTAPPAAAAETGESADPVSGAAPAPDGQLSVFFHGDGRLVTITRIGMIDSEKTGTWRWKSSVDRKFMIACTLAQQQSDLVIEWIDDDTIKMTPPNLAGLTIKQVFRRKR